MASFDENFSASGFFTTQCPTCGCPLNIEEKEDSIKCPQCDNVYRVSDLSRGNSSFSSSSGLDMATIALSIDTPESGLVYLENFFANYNWETYMQTSAISINEIDLMVEKNKIKNGANASAWILDFESKATPLSKKFEGLKMLEEKMSEDYDPIDNTNALEHFDIYSLVIRNLIDKKDAILKQLATDIEYAKKFNADAKVCEEMESRLNDLKSECNKLKVPERFDSVPAIIATKEKLNKEIAQKLAAEGIDASATYFEALSIYQSSTRDKSRALQLFESIKGFSDSAEYIEKLNKYFNYNYELFSFFGKHFVFKEEKIALFNVDEAGSEKEESPEEKAEAADTSISSYSLYEVIDGEPGKEALFKGLTKLLTCYSNKIFYISKNKNICCYDVNTYEERVIVEGSNGSFSTINGIDNFYFANDGKAFFMRKAIPLNLTTGCFAKIKEFFLKLFKKKPVDAHKSNYSIVYVDMSTATSKVLVEELIDIVDYHEGELFYFVPDADPESEAVHFMCCDVLSGETKELLDDKCDIHNVVDGKVVYSVWTPNDLNKDLYVYDLTTEESILIEKNIYSYFTTIKNRIYYTVGNKNYCPLFSNNTEGTDRLEIMQNVAKIAAVRGGWMYIIKGYNRNRILMKMSTDGSQKLFICSQFKEVVEFTDSYIYYLDINNVLHVVRNDGVDDRIIASDMKRENVIVAYDSIYYLRKETITPNKEAYSLYKMDLSGHNSRKLIFNVDSFKNYDKDSLYLMRKENVRFEIVTPISAKETVTNYENFDVTRFFKFNKNTEEITTVLSLGLPTTDKYEFKSGCLKKKIESTSTFREVPNKSLFKHANVAAAGSIYASQMNEINSAKAAKKAK